LFKITDCGAIEKLISTTIDEKSETVRRIHNTNTGGRGLSASK